MKTNREKLEKRIHSHAFERARLIPIESIEEHKSGINQILNLSKKEIVTVSDDCMIKYWTITSNTP